MLVYRSRIIVRLADVLLETMHNNRSIQQWIACRNLASLQRSLHSLLLEFQGHALDICQCEILDTDMIDTEACI